MVHSVVRILARTLVVVVAIGTWSTAAVVHAAPVASYVDTKQRFEITLAGGWELAPMPGDTTGMTFRRLMSGVPALLHVKVIKPPPGQTLKQTVAAEDALFRDEIGYAAGSEVPAAIGGLPGVRRTVSVYASGDRSTVRAVELYVLHAYGYAHVLQFETLDANRGQLTRDVDRMVASYVPRVGRELSTPLSGVWINTGGGPDLTLERTGEFRMGPLNGGWQADGGQLTLQITSGAERYGYLLSGDTLTLSSPNLGGDLVFRRSSSSARPKEMPVAVRTGPLMREELIGRWRALDAAATEPLVLQLASGGSVAFGGLSGRWRYSTGRLTITSTQGTMITYAASMTEGRLVLSGGDLERELTLERE